MSGTYGISGRLIFVEQNVPSIIKCPFSKSVVLADIRELHFTKAGIEWLALLLHSQGKYRVWISARSLVNLWGSRVCVVPPGARWGNALK